MVLETVASVALIEPSVQIVLSLCSIVTMVTVLSMCVCCKRPMKHREEDLEEAYGVIAATAGDATPRVNFRGANHTVVVSERHSQPSTKHTPSAPFGGIRTSAPTHPSHPPRALPPIPADEVDDATPERCEGALYAAINKRGKAPKATVGDDIEYADDDDDGPTATYDTIDPDDSDIDGLYSRVRPSGRRYDYPQFKRGAEDLPPAGPSQQQKRSNGPTYQSGSQIYAPGSEDPYSSIASGPRGAKGQGEGGDTGDSSSAYDPGYARVNPVATGAGPSASSSSKSKDLRSTGARDQRSTAATGQRDENSGGSTDAVERELDQLYSKIRRSESRERSWDRDTVATDGRHPSVSLAGLPGSIIDGHGGGSGDDHHHHLQNGVVNGGGLPNGRLNNTSGGIDLADIRQNSDDQSTASRDPSYRYIAVRESAEAVRARLEREAAAKRHADEDAASAEGVVRREPHYYSTIGGLYESVDDDVRGATSTPQQQQNHQPGAGGFLAVNTTPGSSVAPQPPTSPIPDRSSVQMSPARFAGSSRSQPPSDLYAAINKSSKSPSPGPHHTVSPTTRTSLPYPLSGTRVPGNGDAPARDSSATPAPNSSADAPRDPLGGTTTVARQPSPNGTVNSSARGPFGNPRHATVVKPEDDGFGGGPSVVRRPPGGSDGVRSHESTTVSGGGDRGRASVADERSTVTRYDVGGAAVTRRSPSPLADRSTQTIVRPSVIQVGPSSESSMRERRASPITVVSPGVTFGSGSASVHQNVSAVRQSEGGPTMSPMMASSITNPATMTSSFATTDLTSSAVITPSDGDDIILGRRVVEERETVCERRSVYSSASSRSSILAASEDEMDFDSSARGGAHSARHPHGSARIRNHDVGGSQSARDPRRPPHPHHSSSSLHRGGEPGPEFTANGDRIYRVPITLSDSTQSLGAEKEEVERVHSHRHRDGDANGSKSARSTSSSRSSLPQRQSSEELREAHERSRQRRKSAERGSDSASKMASDGLSPTSARSPLSRSTSRARREREREEERKRLLSSSIYTGRDYISPIDLTTERSWPLVGQSSPPSLRRELAGGADEDLTPRAANQSNSGRGVATSGRSGPGGSPTDRLNNYSGKSQPPIQNGQLPSRLHRTDL